MPDFRLLKTSRYLLLCSATLCGGSGTVFAASPSAVAQINFSETIIITGTEEPVAAPSLETRHGMDSERVKLIDAASADEILRKLPSVHLPTNSRGEAIAFMRNASERQVAVFFDGADINIPWDNRLDLSLIPAGFVSSVRSAAGPLAPHYGVNALGALSLAPVTDFRANIAYGTGDRFDASFSSPLGPAVLGGSYTRRDGDPLSDEADLPYSQPGKKLRTNTDRELGSIFGRITGAFGAHNVSLSAFHVEGEKGIAPESNRASGARFWRYPDVRHSLISANVRSALGASTELNSVVWYQRFGQTINSYADARYDAIQSRQVDRDRTWGIREFFKHRSGPLVFAGSFNFLESTHRQRDIKYRDGRPPAVLPDRLLYKQRNWSVGGEVEYDLSANLKAEIGLGYDVVDYVRTGDKPPVKKAQDWTGRAGLVFEPGDGWRLRGALGRKMRAPTMRERFGEDINRFMPNYDLKPEQILTAEIGVEWRGESGGFYVIPFIQDLDNTIDQRTVNSLRQRINLKGSTVKGVEMGADWRPHPFVTLSGDATWTRVRRKDSSEGELNRIAEKPSLIAGLMADYRNPTGFSTGFEGRHYGRAYSADPSGVLVPLKRSTSFNWRMSQSLPFRQREFEVFLHINNIGDVLIEPQLGLPAPGRSVLIGLRIG